jgi:hypothetical protein
MRPKISIKNGRSERWFPDGPVSRGNMAIGFGVAHATGDIGISSPRRKKSALKYKTFLSTIEHFSVCGVRPHLKICDIACVPRTRASNAYRPGCHARFGTHASVLFYAPQAGPESVYVEQAATTEDRRYPLVPRRLPVPKLGIHLFPVYDRSQKSRKKSETSQQNSRPKDRIRGVECSDSER